MNSKKTFLSITLISLSLSFGQYTTQTGLRISDATSTTPSPGIKYSGSADTDGVLYNSKFINNYGLGFYNKSNGNAYNNGTNTYLSGFFGIDFFTNSQLSLRISREGNVGIGTAEPVEKLEVNGSVYINSENSGLIIDALYGRRVGFMKYSGREAGIWRANYQDFEIGRITTGDLNDGLGTDFKTDFYVSGDGNVGIGTENPTEKLQIGNSFNFHPGEQHDAIGFGYIPSTNSDMNANTYSAELRFKKDSGSLSLGISSDGTSNPTTAFEIWKNNNVTLSYYNWGKVGIGTNTPAAKLHVSSSVIPESSIAQVDANLVIEAKSTTKSINEGATLGFVIPSNTDGGNLWQQGRILVASDNADNYNADGRMYIQTRFFNSINNTWDWNNNLVLRSSGNVGIGTANPDSKLTVKGSIHAEEVKVDLAIAPDYVFEKYYDGYSTLKSDYKMPTLQEVEAFTKENKHLPEVPSSKEIKENGLKLGEMNAILLQKVEELTLYLIEQNKEIEKLKTKVDELSKK